MILTDAELDAQIITSLGAARIEEIHPSKVLQLRMMLRRSESAVLERLVPRGYGGWKRKPFQYRACHDLQALLHEIPSGTPTETLYALLPQTARSREILDPQPVYARARRGHILDTRRNLTRRERWQRKNGRRGKKPS